MRVRDKMSIIPRKGITLLFMTSSFICTSFRFLIYFEQSRRVLSIIGLTVNIFQVYGVMNVKNDLHTV